MKVRIKDLEEFKGSVFGAESFLTHWPELATCGVPVEQIGPDDWYYIIDVNTGWMINDTAFFTEKDMQYLEQID